MNPRVRKVKYHGNYQLQVEFTNNELRWFDLKPYLNYPIYEALKSESFCQKVKVIDGVLQWSEYIDMDPDRVYLESKTYVENV